MKTPPCLLVLTILLFAAASPCFALVEIEDISKERAKALGVTIRSKLVGTDQVYVWLEFKTAGELKNFGHAQLALTAGERSLLSTTLLPERPTPGSVTVFFSADTATLPACVVTVVVKNGERTLVGYRFQMKDFVALEKGS